MGIFDQVRRYRLAKRCVFGARTLFLPGARIDNHLPQRSAIVIGDNCRIAAQLLTYGHGGAIKIGDDSFIGEGTRIWSASSITIGAGVLISHGVNIHDNNSHALSAQARRVHIRQIFGSGHPQTLPDVASEPVCIEDDVWIGFNAIVLKGVRIGRGAVVGAGALVAHDVDAFDIVAGSPAKVIGRASP